ncbi:MAG: hypothetical protein MRQ13_00005, partial [Candidatus Midichloria sp.]|nr:hypothetical protein [Candidatus Midichloria sp.]
ENGCPAFLKPYQVFFLKLLYLELRLDVMYHRKIAHEKTGTMVTDACRYLFVVTTRYPMTTTDYD